MKCWAYSFEDGYGCFWYNKPMGKREMDRKIREHGRLIESHRIA